MRLFWDFNIPDFIRKGSDDIEGLCLKFRISSENSSFEFFDKDKWVNAGAAVCAEEDCEIVIPNEYVPQFVAVGSRFSDSTLIMNLSNGGGLLYDNKWGGSITEFAYTTKEGN